MASGVSVRPWTPYGKSIRHFFTSPDTLMLGVLTGGATASVAPPELRLTTGVGANRWAEKFEFVHSGLAFDTGAVWTWWKVPHYLQSRLYISAGGVGSPTMQVGMNIGSAKGPYPGAAAFLPGFYMRRVFEPGNNRWELVWIYGDTVTPPLIVPFTNNVPLSGGAGPTGTAAVLEMWYRPNSYVRCKVNGVLGLHYEDPVLFPFIFNNYAAADDAGFGWHAGSGSDPGGSVTANFTYAYGETDFRYPIPV